MSALRACLCFPFAFLRRRVKLPFTRRRPPVWLLLAVGGPIFLGAGVSALVVTNQPIFCRSCHEMGLHYATWSQSAHRGVACEDCHVMPGMANMFKSKLSALRLVRRHARGDVSAVAIQGHVPDANCRKCHRETPELVTYHGLKITHRAHWSMGVECTFCHARVVHGPKWLYTGVSSNDEVKRAVITAKNAPTMDICYRCHDGKRAPNECSTCHVSLGEHKPAVFDPAWVQAHREEVKRAKAGDCERCHQPVFCDACHRAADPHPANWLAEHPAAVSKDPSGCPSCHLAPAEPRPADVHRPAEVKKMAFCTACHGLRQEHKEANWTQIHGKESLTNPAACQRCHTANWCAACHAITRPHPAEWTARHGAEASRDPKNCQTCHAQPFCDACHKTRKSVPASHGRDWLAQHKEAARAPKATCATCHTADFCQKCHLQRPPASHGKLWVTEHGVVSRTQDSACKLCHSQSFCDRCHGMRMPHPKDWAARHQETPAADRAQCEKCHQKDGCSACHKGALPVSHASDTWVKQHGGQAKQAGAQCSLCHRPQFCLSCHGTAMPHPKDWLTAGHPAAAKAGRESCLRCHREDDCAKCHGLQIPHPEDWGNSHGKQATAKPETCVRCHTAGRHDCRACHSALPPSSHGAADWKRSHAAGAAQGDLCVLCHGKDACSSCHAAKAKTKSK